MISVAWSIVVCSCASPAVLVTDCWSDSSIADAWPPILCASSRIGTTSATTTSTTTIVMT